MINEEFIFEQIEGPDRGDPKKFERRFQEFQQDFKDKVAELKDELQTHSFASACDIIDDLISDCDLVGAEELQEQLNALLDHIQIEGVRSVKELNPEFKRMLQAFNDSVYMIEDLIAGERVHFAA